MYKKLDSLMLTKKDFKYKLNVHTRHVIPVGCTLLSH